MSLNFGNAIVAQLNANASVKAALLGVPAIYAGYVPDSVPAGGVWISFFRITGPRVTGHDGDEGLAHPRYQFMIGSSDPTQAQALRDIIVKQFNGVTLAYVGSDGNYSLTWLLSEAGDHEGLDEKLRAWTCDIDFFIWSNTEPA